ncbi:solute carrier family 2, facilitated glucose transporter member 6 [Heptranchias perlo]|uniref:solute carrier family 2, facilitated glucose transporter member 6 n=1 Tax=Heptranchias perlo TaxID=212740 RepID=UPI00355A4525
MSNFCKLTKLLEEEIKRETRQNKSGLVDRAKTSLHPKMRNSLLKVPTPHQYSTFRDIINQQETQTGTVCNRWMYLAVFTAVLGNLSFGYAMVYTAPLVPKLQDSPNPNLRLNDKKASLFTSVFTLGTAAGGLSTMLLNDLLGRKLTIMVSSLPSALGFLIMGSAQAVWMLDVGRALTGIAGGMAAASIPVYISEISLAELRGRLGAGPQFMSVCGSFLLFALDLVLPWRWLAVVGAFIPAIMIIILCFMPESPRYLISKHRTDEAIQSLVWLRGAEANFQLEYKEIQESLSRNVTRISCADLRQPFIYKPVLTAVIMRIIQQLSGITVILFNMQLIFKSTKVILKPDVDAVLTAVIRIVSVCIAAWLMDKAGRRKLLFVSGAIMFISTFAFGIYVKLDGLQSNHTTINNISSVHRDHFTVEHLFQHKMSHWLTVIPLISVMLYIFGYALGWGPITWLLMSEILPIKVRGLASGLCVVVSWIVAFFLTDQFLAAKHTFGLAVPFLFFAVISLLSIIFTAVCIPETKGKTLEQIEDEFRNTRAPKSDDNS